MFVARTIDDETWDDLEDALISADFGPDITDAIVDELRGKVASVPHRPTRPTCSGCCARPSRSGSPKLDPTLKLSNRPAVVLVVGVNGVGKTTTIGKFAKFLRNYDRTRRRRRGRHVPRGRGRAARDLGGARRARRSCGRSSRARIRPRSPSRPSRRRSARASRSC